MEVYELHVLHRFALLPTLLCIIDNQLSSARWSVDYMIVCVHVVTQQVIAC